MLRSPGMLWFFEQKGFIIAPPVMGAMVFSNKNGNDYDHPYVASDIFSALSQISLFILDPP
jgi:hypothetical protein